MDKGKLIFGVFLILLVAVFDIIFEHIKFPSWPAFMVMIFFFENHMNIQKVPHILFGGLLGILSIVLIKAFVTIAAPALGVNFAKLIFILAFIYAIVALGDSLPMLFNNYAFMFFLVSGVAAQISDVKPNPFLWIAIELFMGSLLVAGVLGILKLMGLILAPQQTGQETY